MYSIIISMMLEEKVQVIGFNIHKKVKSIFTG